MNYEIGEDDELPHQFTSKLWNHPVGLLVTTAATLILANALNLESISTAGSVGFLLIFAMVNYVGLKLSKDIKGKKLIPFLGFILSLIAMIVLIIQQYSANKIGVLVSIGIITACFVMEFIYKKTEKRSTETNVQ